MSVNLMLGPVIRTPLLDRMSIQLQFIFGNTASWWYLFLYFQHYHVISILMYTCTINYNVNKWLQNVWQFSTVIINWYLKSNDLFYFKFYLICNITWWEHKKTLINRYYIMSLGNIIMICYECSIQFSKTCVFRIFENTNVIFERLDNFHL